MRATVKYEWTLEILQDGDIIDSDFQDTLIVDKSDLIGNDLGLVRSEGNDVEGVTDRYWAYVKNNNLPEFFSNEMGETTSIKVPKKFHNEFKKYINS